MTAMLELFFPYKVVIFHLSDLFIYYIFFWGVGVGH